MTEKERIQKINTKFQNTICEINVITTDDNFWNESFIINIWDFSISVYAITIMIGLWLIYILLVELCYSVAKKICIYLFINCASFAILVVENYHQVSGIR